jgi:methylglutaconyl-CoA hydratase
MSVYQCIEIERRDGHAVLWLNRPQRHNALNAQAITELHRAIEELSEDEAVRVVVLAGRGASFCAGADLNWMREQASASFEENVREARELAYMLRTLAQCVKPTVARVQGAAFGGGLGLVAACDLAIASASVLFGTTEARLGLTPSTISPYVIAAIGERAARRCFLTAARFDAAEARRLGLVHEVCEPGRLDERLNALVDELRLAGPQAQAHCKWLLGELRGRDPSLDEVEETARSLASIRAGEEAREGIEAFFAHRKPSWAP